jgi:4-hydroxy-tetrahydrodipicolinate synthase
MDRAAIQKLIVGPIGAIPTPFDDDFELDLGAMNAMVQRMVENGVANSRGVIKIASAIGEGPMLRDSEWPDLLRTAVRAADTRAPVMFGIHYKDTVRTIEDARRAQDLGAIGLQIAPPIYNLPTQDDMYDYFYEVANAIDIGVMIYHTHWMPGGLIETDTFLRMADIDNVVAVKWGNSGGVVYEDMARFAHIFNVIDNNFDPVGCHRLGGRGYVQTTLDAYPQHDLRVWELLEDRQYDQAEELYRSVFGRIRPFYEKVSKRTGGQSMVSKGLLAVMGHPVGPPRPPSKALNEQEMAELRQMAIDWGWPTP